MSCQKGASPSAPLNASLWMMELWGCGLKRRMLSPKGQAESRGLDCWEVAACHLPSPYQLRGLGNAVSFPGGLHCTTSLESSCLFISL